MNPRMAALLLFGLTASPVLCQDTHVGGLQQAEQALEGESPRGPLFCDKGIVKLQEDRFSSEVSGTASSKLTLEMAPSLVWSSEQADKAAIILTGSHEDWQYLKCHPVYFLADGKRLTGAEPVHSGDVTHGGNVIEQLTVVLAWNDVEAKLGNVQVFEYKICNDEFKADDQFLCQAHDLIRAVKDWKTKQRKH